MAVIELERSRSDLGKANRRAVLSEIIFHSPISRTEIAGRTGLTNASVSRITRELIDADIVCEPATAPAGRQERPGRRHIGLDVNPDGGCVLGIGINAFEQFVSLADLRNRTIDRRELEIGSFADPEEVLGQAAEVADSILSDAKVARGRVFGASVAITGAVNTELGIVRSAPALGWNQVPVGDYLAEKLRLPVQVESLPNAMNLAETRFGIARGHNNVVAFNASLAIGSSFLFDGRLVRGRDDAAGVLRASAPCAPAGTAGRTDGLAVADRAGGWAVLSEVEGSAPPRDKAGVSPEAAKHLLALLGQASAGDERARRALRAAGAALGQVINLVIAILHPEAVIVSGPLSRSADYVEGVREVFSERDALDAEEIPLLVSRLTGQAAARWLAIDEFLTRRPLDLSRLEVREAA